MKTKIIITIETDDNGSVNVRCEQPTERIEDSPSLYAKFFDERNQFWAKNPVVNLMYFRVQEQYANDLLRTKGHLFLNEVYDLLGFPHSSKGAVVGWTYNKENPNGDNYVHFEICNPKFIDGTENTTWIDFNVDGCILGFID